MKATSPGAMRLFFARTPPTIRLLQTQDSSGGTWNAQDHRVRNCHSEISLAHRGQGEQVRAFVWFNE